MFCCILLFKLPYENPHADTFATDAGILSSKACKCTQIGLKIFPNHYRLLPRLASSTRRLEPASFSNDMTPESNQICSKIAPNRYQLLPGLASSTRRLEPASFSRSGGVETNNLQPTAEGNPSFKPFRSGGVAKMVKVRASDWAWGGSGWVDPAY